ncbi:hypothetical protein [Cuneatibacter caecimuris]|uniref:O-antigen ligase n=1 Tax=Cuneatibacter caecimuris TaxID=1796618 RepID=A0A4Q7PMF7_9FIRM|nr:hypothetical protein [Cuneatibacter caecimuris]RZT02072.1 hypothetical protein EV209_0177 [Cuneatibacter caecimuris]
MVIDTRNAKVVKLLIWGTLLSFGITWSYSSNYYIYVFISLIATVFSFGIFFRRFSEIEINCRRICTLLLIISFVTGVIFRFNLKSMIMINTSLLFPFAFSTLNVDVTDIKKGSIAASLLSLVIVFTQIQTGFLGKINSNTFSFLAFMGLSISFIWFEISEIKILPTLFLTVSFFMLLQTGSRNAAIVIVICLILLIIPRRIILKKIVYRIIYLVSLGYTVFALHFMEWGLSNPTISNLLNNYTQSFSTKAWAMEGRADFLAEISQKIAELDLFTKVFGEGVCQHLGHNLFYQCVFSWGYFGTILIYILLILVFEMGYEEAKDGNKIVFGCDIILIGHIIINGADVYLFGPESCSFLPLIIMGLIVQQYMYHHFYVNNGGVIMKTKGRILKKKSL